MLYATPEIYDVAFGWNLEMEMDFVEACFRKHASSPVRRVLEPACGSGRVLVALAERGYEVTGYDRSPEMVAFAGSRVGAPGGGGSEDGSRLGRVLRGDMTTFRPPGRHDAAINLVNSICYLLEEEEVSAHLERVAEALEPGGIYLVQFSYGGEPPEQASFGPWTNKRGGVVTKLTWRVTREDPAAKRSYQECRIEFRREGGESGVAGASGANARGAKTSGANARGANESGVLEEEHMLRFWTMEDFDRILAASPFELEAVYYDRFEEHPLEEPRTGELGNLYHVLRLRDGF